MQVDRYRTQCGQPNCRKIVPIGLFDRHMEYHFDKTLDKNERVCPICDTPVMSKNYARHVKRHESDPQPTKVVEEKKQEVVEEKKQEVIKEKKITKKPRVLPAWVNEQKEEGPLQETKGNDEPPKPAHRPRKFPLLEGETEQERKNRLNRMYVYANRERKRAEKANQPPVSRLRAPVVEGESDEDRKKRLHRERMQRYREKKKANQ